MESYQKGVAWGQRRFMLISIYRIQWFWNISLNSLLLSQKYWKRCIQNKSHKLKITELLLTLFLALTPFRVQTYSFSNCCHFVSSAGGPSDFWGDFFIGPDGEVLDKEGPFDGLFIDVAGEEDFEDNVSFSAFGFFFTSVAFCLFSV